ERPVQADNAPRRADTARNRTGQSNLLCPWHSKLFHFWPWYDNSRLHRERRRQYAHWSDAASPARRGMGLGSALGCADFREGSFVISPTPAGQSKLRVRPATH
ncbi:hypothetical protein CSUI_003710, partial [Cystoisospora suis]